MGWAEFLKPVAMAVRNPPTRDDFLARVSVAGVALSDIPPTMLTPELQRQAVRRFEFWPSVAELGAWLGPLAMAERHERHERRVALAPPEPPPTPRERTEAERAHVTASARAFAADMAALNRPRAAAPTATRPVSDEHLLIAYERAAAAGHEPAAVRAAQLRAKVEANRQ